MKHLLLFLLVIFECGFAMGARLVAIADSIEEYRCMPPRYLRGETTEEGPLVQWTYFDGQGELTIKHFNIYRSATSAIHDFEYIAQVPAMEGVSDYKYLDPVQEGMWYYCVRAFHEYEGQTCESMAAPTPFGKLYLPLDMSCEPGNWQFYDFGDYFYSVELRDYYWGVRFPELRLQWYVGQYVTRIAIYDPEIGQGEYTLRIYKGGEDAPDECVLLQDFTMLGTNDWHYEDVSVPITADNLWVILKSHGVEQPAASVYEYLGGLKDGRWISPDGQSWYDLNDYVGYCRNFMIRIMITTEDGVEEEIGMSDDAQIYPVPTADILHVEADDLKGVEVYDMMGRQVVSLSSTQCDAKEIDLSRCPSGVYLVKLVTGDGVVIRRVGVNK